MSLSSVLADLLNGGDIATRTTAGIPWLLAADAVGKASLLLGAAGMASLALRRASASVRHLIWTLALVGSLVVPALSIALPRWSVPVVTIPATADVAPAASATPPPVLRHPAREASAHRTQSLRRPIDRFGADQRSAEQIASMDARRRAMGDSGCSDSGSPAS